MLYRYWMNAFVTIIYLYSFDAFSFNWEKCQKIALRIDSLGPIWSTTSYVSSSSECSSLGNIQDAKKIFLAQNLDRLIVDSAKGYGEYLQSYASLFGCNEKMHEAFGKIIQKNFQVIYGDETAKKTDEIYYSMENVVIRDILLSKECKIRS